MRKKKRERPNFPELKSMEHGGNCGRWEEDGSRRRNRNLNDVDAAAAEQRNITLDLDSKLPWI